MSYCYWNYHIDRFMVGMPTQGDIEDAEIFVEFPGVDDQHLLTLTNWASQIIAGKNLMGVSFPMQNALKGVAGVQKYMREHTGNTQGPWDNPPEPNSFPCLKCGHELKDVPPTPDHELACPACGFVDHI